MPESPGSKRFRDARSTGRPPSSRPGFSVVAAGTYRSRDLREARYAPGAKGSPSTRSEPRLVHNSVDLYPGTGRTLGQDHVLRLAAQPTGNGTRSERL